jgi:hypothetical protein
VDPGELGPELEQLPGVLAATVFTDAPEGPRVYLAVRSGVDVETLRGDAIAVLRDRGLRVRPDGVHVATPPLRLGTTGLPRITLDSLDVHRTASRVECIVRLRIPPRSTSGAATEPDSPAGRARAAARATLQAAEAIDPDFRFGLHGIRALDLFGHDTVVVLVEASIGRSHSHLPGSALVLRSVEEAAALATLHALRTWTA